MIADYLIIFVDLFIGFLIIFIQFITSKYFCVFFSINIDRIWVFLIANMGFMIVNEFLMSKSVFIMFSMNN